MPRFMPVQCHKCSVLQMKPAQTLGLQWCCSTCSPQTEMKGNPASPGASANSGTHVVVSGVSLFVEEPNGPLEEAEEMGVVANTFRGVECLDGASNWEGLYYKSSKVQQQQALEWRRSVNSIQICEDGFTKVAEVEENSFSDGNWETRQKRGQLLSSLWERWHQRAAKKDVMELMEFAGGPRNEENLPPRS